MIYFCTKHHKISDAKIILSAFQINEGEGFQLLYNYCYRSLVYFADSIVDDLEAAECIVEEGCVDFGRDKGKG